MPTEVNYGQIFLGGFDRGARTVSQTRQLMREREQQKAAKDKIQQLSESDQVEESSIQVAQAELQDLNDRAMDGDKLVTGTMITAATNKVIRLRSRNLEKAINKIPQEIAAASAQDNQFLVKGLEKWAQGKIEQFKVYTEAMGSIQEALDNEDLAKQRALAFTREKELATLRHEQTLAQIAARKGEGKDQAPTRDAMLKFAYAEAQMERVGRQVPGQPSEFSPQEEDELLKRDMNRFGRARYPQAWVDEFGDEGAPLPPQAEEAAGPAGSPRVQKLKTELQRLDTLIGAAEKSEEETRPEPGTVGRLGAAAATEGASAKEQAHTAQRQNLRELEKLRSDREKELKQVLGDEAAAKAFQLIEGQRREVNY